MSRGLTCAARRASDAPLRAPPELSRRGAEADRKRARGRQSSGVRPAFIDDHREPSSSPDLCRRICWRRRVPPDWTTLGETDLLGGSIFLNSGEAQTGKAVGNDRRFVWLPDKRPVPGLVGGDWAPSREVTARGKSQRAARDLPSSEDGEPSLKEAPPIACSPICAGLLDLDQPPGGRTPQCRRRGVNAKNLNPASAR